MKKKFLFLPLAAAMMFAACSSDEDLAENGGNEGIADGRFLAVSIISNGDTSTRGDQYSGPNGLTFEDGEASENVVKNLRIYFFSTSGDAVAIKKNSTVNYYDVPVEDIVTNPADSDDGSENHNVTVERILKAVVVVEAGDKLPAQLVAVINPDTSDKGLGSKSLSLSELTEQINDYASLANGSENLFVMTNSVYPDNGTIVNTTAVSAANYALSEAEATNNPVKIYVERNVAKVRLSANTLEKEGDLYKVYRKGEKKDDGAVVPDSEYKIGEGDAAKQVYLKLDGWDVTADLRYEYLSKHIVYSWEQTYLGAGTTWFSAENHRSYWANVCNPNGRNNYNQYYAYNNANHLKNKKFDGTEWVYCNENTERPAELNLEPTQVLITGTLCDKDGKALNICEYGGNRIIDDEVLTALRKRYALMYTASRDQLPYKQVVDGSTVKYVQLAYTDITFIPIENLNNTPAAGTTDEAKGNPQVTSGRYKVYATLTEDAKAATWYKKITVDAEGKVSVSEADKLTDTKPIEDKLYSLSYAEIWKSGKTYYYFDIKHLGDKWGTVRNHIYDLNLTKIYGIGTPVYDETKVIIPEKPQNDQTFIAAQVNILSWRVVANEVTLDWE